MIIVLKSGTTKAEANEVLADIERAGLKSLYMPGSERIMLAAIGDECSLEQLNVRRHPKVESVKPICSPYKLVSREVHPHDTVVDLDHVAIGGHRFVVIAGPCTITSSEQAIATATLVEHAGAVVFRGGAFSAETTPYKFQGLGLEALEILKEVVLRLQMPSVTEVVDVDDIALIEQYVSAFQVGASNMQNVRLLKELGRQHKPVILTRGTASKVDDLLMAAECILYEGNPNVILCERGIQTFETATRTTLDLNAVPVIKSRSHLPVIVDPCHSTGVRELVAPMAKAAAACGADGLLIEVDSDPTRTPFRQESMYPAQFESFMQELRPFVQAVGKEL